MIATYFIILWCGREDSNFHGLPHSDLNAARLPFRHDRLYICPYSYLWQETFILLEEIKQYILYNQNQPDNIKGDHIEISTLHSTNNYHIDLGQPDHK